MPVATEVSTTKLTVDTAGSVWCLVGDTMPQIVSQDVTSYLSSLASHSCVRVVGLPTNVHLILGLFERKLRGDIRSLEVCSPLCCDQASDRKDPELILYHMRSYNQSPSLGGWHEFGFDDYPTYALAQYFSAGFPYDQYAATLLREHPVWPAVSFVASLNEAACAKLLATVLDPRFYIDLDDPNRGSKLEQYLGVNPRTQGAVSDKREGGWLADRCRVVCTAWKGDFENKPAPAGVRNFLWQIWAERGGGRRGDLAAAKAFISLIRLSWLNEIAGPSHRGRLFIPKYFFGEHVARSYIAHVEKVKANRA